MKRMYFPGWNTQTPYQPQPEQPQRPRQKMPVHLPPLKSRTKVSDRHVREYYQTLLPDQVAFFQRLHLQHQKGKRHLI